MNIHAVVQAMLATNENFKFVTVAFPTSTNEYTYKTTLNLAVGDTVLVNTNAGMRIVTVTGLPQIDDVDLAAYNYQWIVQKIDLEHYNAMKEKEEELLKIIRNKQRNHVANQALEQLFGEGATEQVKRLVRL